MPTFEIVPPSKEDSCYRFFVKSAGSVHRGWMTYELYPAAPGSRTLLLLRGTRDLLSDRAQRREYESLLTELSPRSPGRFGRAKNAVNRLVDGDLQLPNVRVAVHRFGAVPVYVLPEQLTTNYNDSEITVELALYPSSRGPRKSSLGKPGFIPNQTEFVRSLHIGTERLIERYLEDVAEGFYDIEHHLSLRKALERAKSIERILAESVKTKLEAAIPSVQSLSRHRSGKEVDLYGRLSSELFMNKTDTLFTARFSRAYALYFLNEFYRHVGVDDKSDKYLESFRDIRQEFDRRIQQGYYKDTTRERLASVQILYTALRAFHDGRFEDIEKLRIDGCPWAQKFVDFASFVASLHSFSEEFGITPDRGRIFVSHHHDVPITETLKAQIEDWIEKNASATVRVLFFKSDGGPSARTSIKRLIWMSDSLKAIIPKEPAPIRKKDQDKSYLWIALEAEHGLLLDKRLAFLVEDDTDLDVVEQGFREIDDGEFLAPKASLSREERTRRLIEFLRDRVYTSFHVQETSGSAEALDPRVRRVLEEELKGIVSARHVNLLVAFFNQFPPNVRETLVHLHELVPSPKKKPKKWLARKLSENYPQSYRDEDEAKSAVTNTWKLAKKRALSIRGEAEHLLALHNRRYYSARLQEILKTLQPSADSEDLDVVFKTVLSLVRDEVGF